MKSKFFVIKTTLLATLSAVIIAALPISVLANEISPLIKEKPHNIYHVVNNKTLLEATNQIANRAGATFKINPSIKTDIINQKLAADNWNAALVQLLNGYNYTISSDKDVIKTVIITGRNGSGKTNTVTDVSIADLVVVVPDFAKKLPERYKNFNSGSVMNVNLPLSELAALPVGEELTLDLPIGQYKVRHDNLIDHGDGTSTWVGYLAEEGKGYRIYLSQGNAGVIGNVYTPDGAYNFETVDGQTVLVDLNKSGLQTAGYEHDQAEPTTANVFTDIEDAADSASVKANASATETKVSYDKYLQAVNAVKNVQAKINKLNVAITKAKDNLAITEAALKKLPYDIILSARVKMAIAALTSLNNQLAKGVSAKNLATKNMAALYNAYKKLTATNPIGSVVDLMVLYTTNNQTADYAIQRIRYLVDISNQAYKDSKINMSLRLVHAQPTSYVENNSNDQALDDLASGKGAFAGTAALRNQYGADLVMLFRPLHAETAGGCGSTYVGFANGGNADANYGYGTISDGYSNNYFCETSTFTHEIGHSFGTVHDREFSSFPGKFSYSYAWGISGKFGTIMSYYGPSLMLFATPKLATQCAGTPCGFAEGNATSSDQARTINYTAPIVASYKPTKVSVPVIE